jgi:predicted enzyme related to lactoylglutathione lyase
MHYSRLDKIVIDVAPEDHDRELAFWQAALGQTMKHYERFPEYHGTLLEKQRMGLLMQRLGEGVSRVHLDFHTTDVEAEVTRLEKLGAKRLFESGVWWVMEDPAGLPFCVVPDKDLNDENAQRWE